MKKCLCLTFAMVTGAVLYSQIKNGNIKKLIEHCKNHELKMVDELENMMTKSIEEEFITKDCTELYKVFTDADEMLEYINNYDQKDIDLSKVKIR